MENEGADRGGVVREDAQEKKAISNKVIAVVVAVVLLGSSGFYIWHEYYRHWSISDLERAAIVVEWEFKDSTFPNALGFNEHLEGRTVIVEGIVSSAETMMTTLGTITFVYLEGSVFCGLMLWDEPAPEEGTRVEIPVNFERGTINGHEGVYSRQTSMPGFGTFARTQPIIQSVCWTMGELVLVVTDTGEEVILDVEGCPEPIPRDMIRCSLMAGAHMGTQDYIDALGQYSESQCIDSIPDMSSGAGVNGTIMFEDDDEYLDEGDSFVLRNLSRPDTDSGAQTYFLTVERDPYSFEEEEDWRGTVLYAYIIMTKGGALWGCNPSSGTESAVATVHHSTLTEGEAFTVDYISGNLSWNSSVFSFYDGTNIAGWDVPLGALDSGSMETCSLGVEDLGGLRIELIISDRAGNGLVDAGDRMEVITRDGTSLEPGDRYEFRVICHSTGSPAVYEDFTYRAEPVSECTVLTTVDAASVIFGPVHNGTGEDYEDMDVVWGEVLVRLETEGNVSEWHLATEDLWGDGQTLWEFGSSDLGSMSLACSVLDLQGNSAVNAGDRVEIVVLAADDGFSPDAEYTVSFIYLPTGSAIFLGTFSGVS